MYNGNYVDDKKHGDGEYTWADGRVYRGQWLNGKQHGIGFMVLPNGTYKKGRWEDGNRKEYIDIDAQEKIKVEEEI